ncbi:MAG: hypothetical protein MZU97_03175 [Bacillus subtilis]|nr:hypothetical protein [Bacillus subtilis]
MSGNDLHPTPTTHPGAGTSDPAVKNRLLKAAKRLFSSWGYSATSVRDRGGGGGFQACPLLLLQQQGRNLHRDGDRSTSSSPRKSSA